MKSKHCNDYSDIDFTEGAEVFDEAGFVDQPFIDNINISIVVPACDMTYIHGKKMKAHQIKELRQ